MACSILIRTVARNTAGPGPDNEIGDVIDVVPAGHRWSPTERTLFAVIHISDLSVSEARRMFLTPVWTGFELTEPTSAPQIQRNGASFDAPVRRRRRRGVDHISLRASLSQQNRGRLDNAYNPTKKTLRSERLTILWNNFRGHMKDRLSGAGA